MKPAETVPIYLIVSVAWIMLAFVPCASAREPSSSDAAKFFEIEVRPLLVKRCYECHSKEEAGGELQLDSLAATLTGGESGPAIVPGKSDESLLVKAIRYESLEMPPDEKLPDEEIAILARWISIGAPWPAADPKTPPRKRKLFNEEDRKWWAIASVVAPEIPTLDAALSVRAINEIDHFIGSRLTSEGLTPAPQASRLTLVRRIYLDVTGLPPTSEQVDACLNDDSAHAYETLVDHLLETKGYGEHAARQWLDLFRYADSDGYRADGFRPDAFRYHDYVIRSFDEDKPYDRFVQEQIAGDELYPDDIEAQVALGYLRHWVYEWNICDARTQWKTILEYITDTTADVFLGLGLQFVKCHNHKFDPLLQKDYFRLQAFFAPMMPHEVVVADDRQRAEYQQQLARWETETADLRETIAAIQQPYRDKYRDIAIDRFPDDLKTIARKPVDQQSPLDKQLTYLIQRQVQAEYDRLDSYLSGKDKEGKFCKQLVTGST